MHLTIIFKNNFRTCFFICCCCPVTKCYPAPCTAACQASLSFTISWSLLRLMSIESVMLSSYLTLCHSLLILPAIFPSIRVSCNEALLNQVAQVLELQHQSFQCIFRVDFFPNASQNFSLGVG